MVLLSDKCSVYLSKEVLNFIILLSAGAAWTRAWRGRVTPAGRKMRNVALAAERPSGKYFSPALFQAAAPLCSALLCQAALCSASCLVHWGDY